MITAVELRAYDYVPTMTLAMVHRSRYLCVVNDKSAISSRRLLIPLEQSQKVVGAIDHSLYPYGIIVDTE